MSNTNTENTKQSSQMDNIKAISQLTGSEDVSQVFKGVKDAKKRLDTLLSKIKESEKKIQAEQAAIEQEKAASEMVETAEIAQKAFEAEKPVILAEKPSPAVEIPVETAPAMIAVQEEPTSEKHPKKQEKYKEIAPETEQPIVAAPAPAPAPIAEQVPPAPVPASEPKQVVEEKNTEIKSEEKPKSKHEPVKHESVKHGAAKEPVKHTAVKEPVKLETHVPKPAVAEREMVKPIRKISLEELEAINRSRVKSPSPSTDNIKRSFINNPPQREQRPPFNRDGQPRPPYNPGAPRPPYNPGAPRPPYNPNSPRPPYNPGAPRPYKPSLGRPGEAATAIPVTTGPVKNFGNKKKTPEKTSTFEDKKNLNKRTLIKKGLIQTALFDDDRMGRRYKAKKSKQQILEERIKIERATVNTDIIAIKVLSEKLGISATDITKKLFKDGITKTINETLDYDTAAMLALEMGIELELKLDKTAEEVLTEAHIAENETDEKMVARPPVITVMGHVDHGKTSLLDAIRKTTVASGEAGGITQHIGAYTVKMNGQPITFIDTPGHEAFTAMRARGASVTDVAILVVAADDGIMPQSVEAINHIKAAKVPMIVAINKMDKQGANPDRIMQQLTEHNILPEQWGGDTIMVPVSAVTGSGLETLLETILLVSEVRGLKANPDRKAKGTIIEAKLDKGKGPLATVLVQNGTLRVGDTVIAGTTSGRIRAMLDDKGRNVKEAGPSYAVAVLGFSDVPNAGDFIFAVEDEKLSKQVLDERVSKIRQDMVKTAQKMTLDDVFGKISEGQMKGLNLIIKGDVQGSVEAVSQALTKLSNEEVKVNIMHGAAGAITESDIMLAGTADAIIIGFNVRPDTKAKQLAEREGVEIKLYRIIYEAIDDITAALKGMLAPKYKETVSGQAQVRSVFKITGVGAVAGCYVTEGKIPRNAKVRLLRESVVISESTISSLKRYKDDVKEVATGFECGISIDNYNDIKEGDIIEAFMVEQIKA